MPAPRSPLTRSRFFFSSRRRHTRWTGDWSSDCALPILDWRPRRQSLRLSFRSAVGTEIALALVPQPGTCVAFTLEVFERVLQRHAVMLQESVEFVARRDLQELPELMAGQPLHPVRIDGHC